MTDEQISSEKKQAVKNEESLEENGHSLLIVDLLELPKKFSFKRYRMDLTGFAVAWLIVALIIILTIWLAGIGT